MSHWTSSTISSRYAVYRPTYPAVLFEMVAKFCAPTRRHLALDIGCGTGQAVKGLAAHFSTVIGVDPSATQVAEAWQPPQGDPAKVSYVVGGAENFVVDPTVSSTNAQLRGAVDVVTVAQAMHWFHIPQFVAHVRPLLRDGGILAAWNYQTCRVNPPAIGAAVDAMDQMLMAKGYWPPERKHVDDNYASLVADIHTTGAFKLVHQEQLLHSVHMTVADALLYFSTWSGVQRFAKAHPNGPHLLEELEKQCYANVRSKAERVELVFPINYFIFEAITTSPKSKL